MTAPVQKIVFVEPSSAIATGPFAPGGHSSGVSQDFESRGRMLWVSHEHRTVDFGGFGGNFEKTWLQVRIGKSWFDFPCSRRIASQSVNAPESQVTVEDSVRNIENSDIGNDIFQTSGAFHRLPADRMRIKAGLTTRKGFRNSGELKQGFRP